MPHALITDAQERSVLAACRSLHRGGYVVDVAASDHPAVAHWSRACAERLTVTDPKTDPARFVEELAELADRGGHDVLIPGSDAALLAISKGRDRFEGLVRVGLPGERAVERTLSKVALLDAASAAGLPAPETVVCSEDGQAVAAARRFGYPIVLKPHQSIFEHGAGLRQRGTSVVGHEGALERLLPEHGRPCLVQRRQSGTVLSFAGVITDGDLLARAVSRYARTWPPDAGNVSFSETVPPPPGLSDRVRELLIALGWEGIFELELLEGPDGRTSTIDLNPRVYGSLALAGEAGSPLALIWCEWLRGRSPAATTAEAGYRYRWDDAELRGLWWLLRRGRFRAAISVIRPRPRTVRAHLWASDPLPFLARMTVLFRKWIRYVGERASPTGRATRPGIGSHTR
jgi:predicted ATP-grasp superfamily ATP-dependent carboligase